MAIAYNITLKGEIFLERFTDWSLNIGLPIGLLIVFVLIITAVYFKHFPKKGDFIKALKGEKIR